MEKNLYPVDEICEKTVLGIILMSPDENMSAISDLNEEDFYWDNCRNRYLFTAIKSLAINNMPIDTTSVYNFLNDKKTLNIVGGFEYITSLCELVTNFNNTQYYIDTLKSITMLRSYLMKLDEAEKEYLDKPMEDIEGFINRYQAQLVEIANRRKTSGFDSLRDVALQLDERIKASKGGDGAIKGYRTGFKNLDKRLNGLNKGNMIIIAGRPGMGKSTLSLNIAYNVAKLSNKPVAYFSLEMESDRLVTKLYSALSAVDSRRIENGVLDNNERARLSEAKDRLLSVPLFIDGKRNNNMSDISVKSKKLKDQYGDLGLIIIDHIGITDKETTRKFNSDTEELKYKSRECKKLAGELDCPVICVSQLNRQVEGRDTKIPQLSDLRGSGGLEEDADQVILLYREKYYEEQGIKSGKNTNKKEVSEEAPSNKVEAPEDGQIVQLTVAKNRNGEPGITQLFFFPKYSRFDVPSDDSLKTFADIQAKKE